MKSEQYLAAAAFKLFCADFKKSYITYPKLFRGAYMEGKRLNETLDSLLGVLLPKRTIRRGSIE